MLPMPAAHGPVDTTFGDAANAGSVQFFGVQVMDPGLNIPALQDGCTPANS